MAAKIKNQHLIGATIKFNYAGRAKIIGVTENGLTCKVEYERTRHIEDWSTRYIKSNCKMIAVRVERLIVAHGKGNGHNADNWWLIVDADGAMNGTEVWLEPIAVRDAA